MFGSSTRNSDPAGIIPWRLRFGGRLHANVAGEPLPNCGDMLGRAKRSVRADIDQAQTRTRRRRWSTYSISSSARARSEAGTVIPIAFALLRLTTRLNLVGCCTGRSPGFSPLLSRDFARPLVSTSARRCECCDPSSSPTRQAAAKIPQHKRYFAALAQSPSGPRSCALHSVARSTIAATRLPLPREVR